MPEQGQAESRQTEARLSRKDGICCLAPAYCRKCRCGPKVARFSAFSRETGNLNFHFRSQEISALAPNFNLFEIPVR